MNATKERRALFSRALGWPVFALALGLALGLPAHGQRTATAVAQVVNGFVVAVTVTDGGARYPVPPLVTITGGGGSGATAEATVTNGVVVGIKVTDAGQGYTAIPTVVIADPPSPPEAPVLESVELASRLTIRGLVGTTNWILYADTLDTNNWRVLTNLVVTSSPYVVMDWGASPLRRFYQAASGPQPVSPLDPTRWAWIPPGTFTMGSPDNEKDRAYNEGPQTQVTITGGFWMGRYEVTQGEYQALMGSNPSHFTGDPNCPVECVSWYDATNYCAKLTEKDWAAGRLLVGYVYRLPTEAEWEYACRAGTTTRFSYGDDPEYSQLGNYAWYRDNSEGTTHAVGLKQPNPWGLYDMYGNVYDWCLDWWSGSLPGGSVTDPKGPDSGSFRVFRGGSWNEAGGGCRSASIGGQPPDSWYTDRGFRVVLAAGQP